MKFIKLIFPLILLYISSFTYAQIGESCTVPLIAEGVNHVPALINGTTYWYTFTMPDVANKKLVITSENNEVVTIYKKACDNLSQLANGNGTLSISDLLPKTQVTIKWTISGGGNFDWNLAIQDPSAGDSYSTAVTAIEGTNRLPKFVGTKYWYRFTMPSSNRKKLVIAGASLGVSLYSNSVEEIQFERNYSGDLVTISLNPGQECFLSWDSFYGSDFDWDLSVKEIEASDDCSSAKQAILGSNQAITNQKSSYWYSFTMPNITGKRLVITAESQTSTYMEVYLNCNVNDVNNLKAFGQGQITVSDLQPNQKIYIKWLYYSGYSDRDLTWNLSLDDGGLGASCLDALPANLGANTIHDTGQFKVQYFFSVPNPIGKKIIITSSTSNMVYIRYNSCDEVRYDNGTGSAEGTAYWAGGLKANQQIFIEWYTSAEKEFDWNLSVVDLESGDLCSVSTPSLIGSNAVPALEISSVYWYSFQMPPSSGKKLIITTAFNENVVVYTGSCNEPKFYDYSNFGNIAVTGLQPNEEVLIAWGNTLGDFSWTLTLEDEVEGESCINSLGAVIGNNVAPNVPSWFNYTIPVRGNYTISSVGLTTTDTYLSVYNNCNGELLTQNDDYKALQSEVKLTDLEAGTVILIKWENKYANGLNTEGFKWNLSFEKLNQKIDFSGLPVKTYGDSPFMLIGSASSALPLSYTSSNTEVALISGNKLTIVGAGTSTLTATQTGDSFFNSQSVERTLTVNKAEQTISFNSISNVVLGSQSFNLIATASSSLPVSFSTISNKVIVEGKRVTPLKAGVITIEASQNGSDNYNAAQRIVQTFCVTPSTPSIVSSAQAGSILLTSSAAEGNQWYKEDILIGGASQNTFEANNSGLYSVVTTIEECSSSPSEKVAVMITGDVSSINNVKIYPNPVEDELEIELEPGIYSQISIIDAAGGLIHQESGVGRIRLKTSNLSSGNYFIQIQDNSSIKIRKFIKK